MQKMNLSEDLTETKNRTIDDEWLAVEITDIHAEDSTIRMKVDHQDLIWEFDRPIVWHDESTFVQLVESLGFSAEGIDFIEGETIHIRPSNNPHSGLTDTSGQWELKTPTEDSSGIMKEMGVTIASLFVIFIGVGLPIICLGILGTLLINNQLLLDIFYFLCGFGWLTGFIRFITHVPKMMKNLAD